MDAQVQSTAQAQSSHSGTTSRRLSNALRIWAVTDRRIRFGLRVIGAVGAGALLAASFPPFGVTHVLPLAIAALPLLLEGATVREAAYIGLAYGVALYAITLFWFVHLFGAAAISLWAIEAGFTCLFAALFTWLRARLPKISLWLLAAVTWTAVEYYRSEPFVLNFGGMAPGYALVNVHALAALPHGLDRMASRSEWLC